MPSGTHQTIIGKHNQNIIEKAKGHTAQDIAKETGLSVTTVRRHAKVLGIQLKPLIERKKYRKAKRNW